MSLSSAELWQRISASQLASPMQCRAWAAEASAGLSASQAIDGERLTAQLVAQGKLTQFQADSLLSGSHQGLVKHGWRILQPIVAAGLQPFDVRGVWPEWWLAAKTPGGPSAWLRWLSGDDLKRAEIRGGNPALPLVLKHAQITHPHLQPIAAPEMVDRTLQLQAAPHAGTLLSGQCGANVWAVERVMPMLMQVAAGLSALHAAGVVHGRVVPDRICLSQDGKWTLLRDPLCSHTLDLSSQPRGLLSQQLPARTMAAHFMAPEFLLPAQSETAQSDCFALGCTAWLLMTGGPPATGTKPEHVLAAQAEQLLSTERVTHVPEPLRRVLMHCLAKNPAARFASATQLHTSLEEVQRLLSGGASLLTNRSAGKPTPASQKQSTKPTVAAAVTAKPVDVQSSETASNTDAGKAAARSRVTSASNSTSVAAAVVKAKAVTADKIATATAANAVVAAQVVPAVVVPSEAALNDNNDTASRSDEAKSPKATAQTLAGAAGSVPPVRRAAPVVRSSVRARNAKRKKSNTWLTALIAGGAMITLLLVVLLMNGGVGSSSADNRAASNNNNGAVAPHAGETTVDNVASDAAESNVVAVDPRAEFFDFVDSASGVLWAPPRAPQPIALDLLPPGGQMFIALRPSELFAQPQAKQLLSLLDADISPFWLWLQTEVGLPAQELTEVVLAAYPGQSGTPQYAVRVHIEPARTLAELKRGWNDISETKVDDQTMLISGSRGFYVAAQPFVDSQSVSDFVVGPTELIREAVDMHGATGPLTTQLEQLWQWTDRQAQVSLLLNPSFLFTEGRQLTARSPARLAEQFQKWLARDMRGAMLTTSIHDEWFYELRLVGASDRDAGAIQQKLRDELQRLPEQVESWLVSQAPHPHWRAVAMRYPNMLRALAAQTRVSVEHGQAIANGYLPSSAAPNVLYASWLAMQPAATESFSTSNIASTEPAAQSPLTVEQILQRPVTVVVDADGIEVVWRLIGEQANEGLPASTTPLRFELDGAAFQRGGITRNQQIRGFKIESLPVRAAMTELTRLGNPVPGADMGSADQKLIWIAVPRADRPGETTISLTTREAAIAAKHSLPPEFSPAEK